MKEFTSKEVNEILGNSSKSFLSFLRRKVIGVSKPTRRMVGNRHGLTEGIVPIYHYDTVECINAIKLSMSRLNHLHNTGVKMRTIEAHNKAIKSLERILNA